MNLPAQYTALVSPRLDVSARITRAERFFGATGATLAHGGNHLAAEVAAGRIVLGTDYPSRGWMPRSNTSCEHPA